LALYGVNNFDIINISVDCNGNRGILFGDKDPSSLTYRSGNTLFENVSITSTSKGISFQVPGGYNRFKRVNMTVNANGQAVDIGKSLTNTVLLANYIFFDDCSFISGNSNTIAFDLNAIQYMQINKVDMARFTKGINIENTREVSNIIVSGNYFFNNSNASTSVYIQTGAIFRNLTLRDNNHLHTNGTFINIQSGTNRVNDMLIDGDFCQGTYTNGYILNDVELKLTDIKVFAGVTFDDKSTIGSNVNIDYQNLKPPPQYEQNVVPAAGRAYDFNQDALPEKVPMGVVESVESSSGDEVPVRFTQAYIGDGTTLRITVTNTHSANADFTVWIP
ncbi:MAG: hypothetical protein GWN76_21425, partial [candidate division Zixibacteria bacterium]|nr:hypothetical protein [Phycisphaerae bacterium]NIR66915.1 hypothetical protein [candidate division Zixibacteria bacterium]NIW48406.1 hypothetical protein [Gammaproteobacteria bacterium]NIS52133.1 hypothetical protein [Phycisphaerae bacterium]NIU16494.1 hypothetical protein [candidate division Zixibacteria bacterium]